MVKCLSPSKQLFSTSCLLATALLEQQAGSLEADSDPVVSFLGCVTLVSYPIGQVYFIHSLTYPY